MTTEHGARTLAEQTSLFTDTISGTAADAPVPTCPRWTLRELVEHLGQTQHWVASIVEDRVADPSQLPTSVPPLPADRDDWPAWMADGAARLGAACGEAGPDAPVWNPAGDGRTGTEFWLHRIVAETVIHRADAAATAGVAYELDDDLAADVITDHLAMMTSPAWAVQVPESAGALRGNGETLHLHTRSGDWVVERGPAGATWTHGSPMSDADVTVSGPATSLLLVLTRRRPISDAPELEISGDADLLTHWVEHTAHEAT